ncbi:amino acid ABC transporter ATP-binding protein [Streptomyces sp. NPDC052042]|uniref:amino acid ABC transporter ATP-binding protein n=1 Tax=Streptomyces sp. NPDC052042 TaxID=3365683 RepID=UPI0037D7CAB8
MTTTPTTRDDDVAIDIRGLRKAYGSTVVLDGIDLRVRRGQVVCLIGRSGCGKSTLLRCMNGLALPDSGEVTVLSHRISGGRPDLDGLRTRVGMVFQSYNLFPHRRVIDNVATGPRKVLRRGKEESLSIAREQLRLVGLEEKAALWPSQLSGGQQQRVAIARSLAMNPDVLLLDEVTAALDPDTVGSVLAVIRQLAGQGITMVLVTHEMSFAYDVSDVVAYIEAGKVVEIGSPKDVLTSPTDERTRKFLSRTLPDASVPRLDDSPSASRTGADA